MILPALSFLAQELSLVAPPARIFNSPSERAPNVSQSRSIGAKQDFTAGVQQLTSQLTLDNLINAKAKGALAGAFFGSKFTEMGIGS